MSKKSYYVDILIREYLEQKTEITLRNTILKAIKKTRTEERKKSEKYKVFHDHIENHLKPNQKVICKICNKNIDEIFEEYLINKVKFKKVVKDDTHKSNM